MRDSLTFRYCRRHRQPQQQQSTTTTTTASTTQLQSDAALFTVPKCQCQYPKYCDVLRT